MSIANKLTYLNDTREKIRGGLNKLGAGILPNDTFRSYVDAIDDIYDSMPKVEEGDVESATLDGTIEGGLQLNLKGNTSQYTTTGKNKIPFTTQDFTLNNIRYYVDNGTLYVNGTSSGETNRTNNNFKTNFKFTLPAGTYTFSKETKPLPPVFIIKYSDNTNLASLMDNTLSATFTLNEETEVYIGFYIYQMSFNNLMPKIMLSLSGGEYEPYTGNQPSPNPSYPQPVNVVSGDNEVVVCGINIWDEEWEQGFIQFNKNASNWGQNLASTTQIRSKNYIPVDENTTYYGYLGANSVIFAIVYDKNKQPIAIGDSGYTNITNQTFTLPSNARYIRFYTIGDYGGTYLNDICINVSNDSINGHYYPYQSQTYPIYLPVENLIAHDLATIKTLNTGGTWSDNVYTQNSLNFTINNDGSVRVNGTASANTYLTYPTFTLKAGTYTLGAGIYINTLTRIQLVEDISGRPIITSTENGASSTFTTSADKSAFLQWRINSGEVIDKVFYPMLEKGSKANHYTEYGTTPIELCKIGDYQDYFTKNSGKQLIPLTNQDFTKNNIHYYIKNGIVYADGTSTGETGTSDEAYRTNFNFTLPAGTYTMKGNKVIGWYLKRYDDNTQIFSNPSYVSDTPRTFTLAEETKLYISLYVYQQSWNNQEAKVMINKGETAEMYEPYGTGLWCKYNAIGKVVLNGSEVGWARSNPNDYITINNALAQNSYAYANYFKCVDTNTGRYGDFKWSASQKWLIFLNTESVFLTLDDFKTWLSTHNTEVRYILATPYLSLIEDTTLINQLDEIEAAKSYEGQTNVNQTNNDLPFKIDAKAILDWRN